MTPSHEKSLGDEDPQPDPDPSEWIPQARESLESLIQVGESFDSQGVDIFESWLSHLRQGRKGMDI